MSRTASNGYNNNLNFFGYVGLMLTLLFILCCKQSRSQIVVNSHKQVSIHIKKNKCLVNDTLQIKTKIEIRKHSIVLKETGHKPVVFELVSREYNDLNKSDVYYCYLGANEVSLELIYSLNKVVILYSDTFLTDYFYK